MLKKLIKHEWAQTWKIPALALFVTLALSAACALYFFLAPEPAPDVELNVGNLVLFLLYAFYSAFVPLLITIYLGIRFYKNLYTDEGYLMHTLPVQPQALILSKTITGVFWSYLSGIVTLVTVLPISLLAVTKLAYFDEAELAELTESLSQILSLFGNNIWELLFYFLPYMIASSLFSILLLYAAICLGQLFGKHKVLSSILCYLGLNALLSTASAMLTVPGLTGVVITHADEADDFFTLVMPSIMRTTYFITFLSSLFLSAVCFWLCSYLMKKNLNLD